jgi:hypothetical protein
MHSRRTTWFLCSVSFAGLWACDDKPPVPAVPPTVTAPVSPAEPAADVAAPSTATDDVHVFEPGTHSVSIEGAKIDVGTRDLAALLAVDADGDGDRDALVLSKAPAAIAPAAIAFEFRKRDGEAFAAPVPLSLDGIALAECSATDTVLSRIGPAHVLLSHRCDAAAGSATQHYLVGLGASPSVRERLTLFATDSEGGPELALENWELVDLDGDKHADLRASLRVGPAGTKALFPLLWVDRPSGLARDAKSIETAFAAFAAKDSAAPQAALGATEWLGAYDALCQESAGKPRLELGSALGLRCANADTARTFRAAAVLDDARRGAVAVALRGYLALPAALRGTTLPALLDVLAAAGKVVRAPSAAVLDVTLSERGPGQISRLAFVSETALLLRGSEARVLDLASGATTPSADRTHDAVAHEPEGNRVVAGLKHHCGGTSLLVADEGAVLGGLLIGRPSAEPPIDAAARTTCDAASAAAARPVEVLGWSPQGIVTAIATDVHVTPAAEGGTFGATFMLAAGAPLPAPLPSGAVAPGGDTVAVPFEAGVLLWRPSDAASVKLVVPSSGWPTGSLPDVAVSPAATTLAFAAGGKIWILRP